MTLERNIQRTIHLKLGSRPDVRLWRFNAGKAWVRTKHGSRPQQFTPDGIPDLCGWVMVRGVPVVLGIEVKSEKGKQRKSQLLAQHIFERFGAIYILARSVTEAEQKLAAAVADVERRLT